MGTSLLRSPAQLDRVMGVVGTNPGNHMGAIPDGLDHGAQKSVLLIIRGGG